MDVFNHIPLLKKYNHEVNKFHITDLNNVLEKSKKHIKPDRFSLYFHIKELTDYDQNCGTIINICHEFESICKELYAGQKSDFTPNVYENPNIFEYIPILNKYNKRGREYHIRHLFRTLFWAANVNKYGDDYFFKSVTDMDNIHWNIAHNINELMKYNENCSTIIGICHDFESVCQKLQNKPHEKKHYHYHEVNILEEFPELKKHYNDPSDFHIRNLEKIVFRSINSYIHSDDIYFQKIFTDYEHDMKHIEYHIKNLYKIEDKNKLCSKIRDFCEKKINDKSLMSVPIIDDDFCFDFDRKIDMTICI